VVICHSTIKDGTGLASLIVEMSRLKEFIRSRPAAVRVVAIFLVSILGVTSGWVAALALHSVVHPAATPPPPAAQGQPDTPRTASPTRPDVIIAIPKGDGDDGQRYQYLSLGQMLKGIGKAKHHKKHHDDKD